MTPLSPRHADTRTMVAHFQAGLSVAQIAKKTNQPRLTVEQAIRRYLEVYDVRPGGGP